MLTSLFLGLRGRSGILSALGVALALAAASCTPGSDLPDEHVGEAQNAVFVNGSFETGAAGAPPPSWTVQAFLNPGITVQFPQTRAGLNLQPGGHALTTIVNGTNQPDPDLGAGASLRWPRYGTQCARVNFHSSTNFGNPNNGRNVNSLSQTMTIAAGDVDPADGLVHVRFVVAPVLQNPAHAANQQPYYLVQVTNVTQGTILYTDFNLSAQAGVPWKRVNAGTAQEIDYVDWSLVDVAPGPAKLAIGNVVTVEVIASGCSLGGHFGEVYVDGAGATVPGLFVSGTAPTQVNAGASLAYAMSYKNGSAAAETGVAIDFTTPPNTTFQALVPPAGATCVTPLVGAAGIIVCTFAAGVPAGAGGTFSLTVNVNVGSTGQIVAGNYDIRSTQEGALLGSKIVTSVGCTSDSACLAGTWCNESADSCTPKLANGIGIPTDAPHLNPTLSGLCTAPAATLVCASAVCDTTDDKCGDLNAHGPCLPATGAVLCRSGVCDKDGSCGYAVGDGPCTVLNGASVCRSTTCSVGGLCQPLGGCNLDGDCAAGNWCNEGTHACTPRLPNGTSIPTDATHAAPTLNGACTLLAAALVCQSGVCDVADSKCGHAVGTGPCTLLTGPTVCRSGECSNNALCEPAGGCNVDPDCSAGEWCNEGTHTCSAKLSNGVGLPTDAPHTVPTLNGLCSVAAATLVCLSDVCDSADNKCGKLNSHGPCLPANGAVVCRSAVCDPDGSCGYALGDGPCTSLNGGTVCRSTSCSVGGLCQPLAGCNLDGDCTGGAWCNESAHACTPKLANGLEIPTDAPHTAPTLSGACTSAAATLVCQSSVCQASDNECGYPVGAGPCTVANGATLCRSGACSSNGLCEPTGGCNADADCAGGNWCNEGTHTCTPKLANGVALPTDATHVTPTLTGICLQPAATLVCQSAVCDAADNKCGYAAGDGPCTLANGVTLCRSGACSSNGLCKAAAGCNVDADCASGNWCNELAHACTPQLANGSALPTDGPHTSPALNGTCTAAAATLVCRSGVCDSADNQCGYASGDGPCTATTGPSVCRSGACSPGGLCQPAAGCSLDADCPTGKWCNESTSACLPTLPNASAIPTDAPHTQPTLNGTCTNAVGALVCTSGVCDTLDNECGYENGVGPCTAANGETVCRSTLCATSGLTAGTCAACLLDAQCAGATPVCNTDTSLCVGCLIAAQCAGATPVCDQNSSSCVPCNGDNASAATEPCTSATAPFCFLSGATPGTCGSCASNADCEGHTGTLCDAASGLCVAGCAVDSDCDPQDWCNAEPAAVGACVPKLDNGSPLPSNPSTVVTCTSDVGARVCSSGSCDPKDNACGLAPGDGSCASTDQCRAGSCDAASMTCAAGCTTDPDCPAADFCQSDGTCTAKLPKGAACIPNDQCQSGICVHGVCSTIVGSGGGLSCATRLVGGSGQGGSAGIFGLLLALGLARRRRSRRAG